MNPAQWQQALGHVGFSFSCAACTAVALLDTRSFREAQSFQLEHKRIAGHGVGETTLRPPDIMPLIENIDLETATLLKAFTLITPQEMNRMEKHR